MKKEIITTHQTQPPKEVPRDKLKMITTKEINLKIEEPEVFESANSEMITTHNIEAILKKRQQAKKKKARKKK